MQIGDKASLAFIGMCIIVMAVFFVVGTFVIPNI
jgi:succinate dehydrogenase hydrophobic anchor subunit